MCQPLVLVVARVEAKNSAPRSRRGQKEIRFRRGICRRARATSFRIPACPPTELSRKFPGSWRERPGGVRPPSSKSGRWVANFSSVVACFRCVVLENYAFAWTELFSPGLAHSNYAITVCRTNSLLVKHVLPPYFSCRLNHYEHQFCNMEHQQEEVQDGLDGGELSTQMRGKVRLTDKQTER